MLKRGINAKYIVKLHRNASKGYKNLDKIYVFQLGTLTRVCRRLHAKNMYGMFGANIHLKPKLAFSRAIKKCNDIQVGRVNKIVKFFLIFL